MYAVRTPINVYFSHIFLRNTPAPCMVSESLLVDITGCLPLVLRDLLWYLSNRQETHWGEVLTFMVFLGVITILDHVRQYLKVQWFSLWFQAKISLLSHIKKSSIDHSLAISSLVVSVTTTSLSAYSKLVGIWGGISVRVGRSYPDSRLSSWTRI